MPDRLVFAGRALVEAAGGGCPALSRRVRGLGSTHARWRLFYARTQLRMRLSTRARSSVLWNRQSASSLPLAFGAPGGAVVGARRDAWRSDGVLRDGSYEEYRFCTEAKS